MSRALEYPAKCSECSRSMRAGTLVDFFKDGGGGYSYIHAGNCPTEEPAKPLRQPRSVERDTYICPHCLADWCFDKGAFARGKGRGVPVCPTCRKPWDVLYADIEAGAV